MKKIRFALILACFMMFCAACGTAAVQSGPTIPETEAPSESTVPPETTAAVAEIPETTVPVTTLPLPVPETGPLVTVDGALVKSDSIILDGCVYANAFDMLSRLKGAQVEEDAASGLTLRRLDLEIRLNPEEKMPLVNGTPAELSRSMLVYDGALYLPVEEFSALFSDVSFFRDEGRERIYWTSGIKNIQVPQGISVPVLMYHAVSDDMWGIDELFVSPSDMDQQLAYLVDNGYDPIFFEDLPFVEQYDKPVILTFDDGYLDNYTELYPLLQKYNVKATIFIITETMGVNQHSMTWDQVHELSDSGLVSIQSHTCTHQELSALSYEEQLYEIRESKYKTAHICGKEPFVLCYPSGERNSDTLEIVPEYYDFGIDMNGGLYTTGENPYTVSRYYISRYTSLGEFASMVSAAG